VGREALPTLVSFPAMLRVILQGLVLRREAYLRMVLAREGVADAALVVGAVYLLLAVPGLLGSAGLLAAAGFVIGGVFGWIVLAGLTYLVGRHVLEGDGTLPSVMAAAGLAFPPLVVSLALRPFLPPFVALAAASAWLLACLWQAARVSLDLSPGRAAAAAAGGYGGWLVLSALSVI
jgi:hypothetical protein